MESLDSKGLADLNDDHMQRQYICDIRHYNAEIALLEKEIARQASVSKDARILTGMTGIDCYTAMLLASEIDGIGRFATPKKLVSWAGMCPTIHQSGDTSYRGKMKKDSNRRAKWVLTQSANVAVRHDDRMRAYYDRARKTRHHNVAISHVANKAAAIIWHVLTDAIPYENGDERLYRKKRKRMDAVR